MECWNDARMWLVLCALVRKKTCVLAAGDQQLVWTSKTSALGSGDAHEALGPWYARLQPSACGRSGERQSVPVNHIAQISWIMRAQLMPHECFLKIPSQTDAGLCRGYRRRFS